MINYLTLNIAYNEHQKIIVETGGLSGIRNQRLDSVLEHIKNDSYYPSFEDKLCHLVFSVAENHSFQDGNKRSSIVLGSLFLKINGYPDKVINDFIQKMEALVLMLVEKEICKDDLNGYIYFIINQEEMPEEFLEPLETRLKKERGY
ncbi:Fic family protein [Lactococcus lactis]|uniref:type II toxin-antitoxin system death-on-curing family toxin n=1 Tax=Lactococcus lactis TaxID=1358 RepID=UPI0030FE9008|nr:Fic family protein [Lactococcus lactis]